MTTKLALVGDINCKRDVLAETALDRVDPELERADVRLGNLEGAFYDPTVELDYKPGWYHCEPDAVSFVTGRFDAVACANNVHHGAAIATSTALLDDVGIGHAGAGRDRSAARRPAIVHRAGATVGLLAFTSVHWPIGHVATSGEPGVAAIRARTAYEPHPRIVEMPAAPAIVRSEPEPVDLAAAQEDVSRLREQVDIVVVYCHWGVTRSEVAAEYQETIGRSLIDAGATIVAGSHPHVPQAVERYGHGVILYSLGNFMFGWRLHRHLTSDGLLARVEVDDGRVGRVGLVPLHRDDANQVELLTPDSPDGTRIGRRVAELSERYGTRLVATDDDYEVVAAARPDGAGRSAVADHAAA
jgi:poly-gamma-glutamate synthesis protein (capsule biosynthesis protein)